MLAITSWCNASTVKPLKSNVWMFSKLGGAFVGQAQAQKPEESKEVFLKRLRLVAAKLMPHERLWRQECMSVGLV
jgi:hypothetical protein